MTEIHITADSEYWTGASTLAVLAASQAENAIVITAGSDEIVRRIEAAGIKAAKCPMGGMFGALNLSRALRHVEGNEFQIYVHSPSVRSAVESALKLVGRAEPMTLVSENPQFGFPPVNVTKPEANEEYPTLMWLGNITADCGLHEFIEELGSLKDKQWRLRVVGQGKAKIVGPILKRTKALGLHDRIEWIGYSSNPYEQMNGVTAGIVKNQNSVVAREFAAASIPTYTNLSNLL